MDFKIEKQLIGKCWKMGNSKKYLVLHHTASSKQTTLQGILRFFQLSELVSCHYIIGRYGEITQIVDDNDRAWHAGKSSYGKDTNLNNCSIGIEILSDGEEFGDCQREATRWLCKKLCSEYKIPFKFVLRHADIAPGRKTDVGRNFYSPYWGKNWSDFQISLARKL